MIETIFGNSGLTRFVVCLAYAVAVLGGFLFGLGHVGLGLLIVAVSLGILTVGTLKEHREAQDGNLSDE